MKTIFTLEEGAEYIFSQLNRFTKPCLLGIFGSPNSGKTELGKTITKVFKEYNKISNYFPLKSNELSDVQSNENLFDIITIEYPFGLDKVSLLLINKELKSSLSKDLDLKVIMYHPRISYSLHVYACSELDATDIVIANNYDLRELKYKIRS